MEIESRRTRSTMRMKQKSSLLRNACISYKEDLKTYDEDDDFIQCNPTFPRVDSEYTLFLRVGFIQSDRASLNAVLFVEMKYNDFFPCPAPVCTRRYLRMLVFLPV
mmetsp:Transcript_7060/g.10730  ORF Transcript_7060/g.10730 Transcript_7060/m.10730 type:complete len:106 (+) Transcript_7060:249-566(+)